MACKKMKLVAIKSRDKNVSSSFTIPHADSFNREKPIIKSQSAKNFFIQQQNSANCRTPIHVP